MKEKYYSEIRPKLQKELGYRSIEQVPRLTKIALNMGVGDAKQNTSMLDAAVEQLSQIAGQHPSIRRAKTSVAGFKVRDGMPVGVAVTLRRERMYELFDRITTIAIPRVRDFRGLNPRSFDGRGNFSFGIKEQLVFPEIDYDSIDQVRGLDVTIATSAATDDEARLLLEAFGFPFRQIEEQQSPPEEGDQSRPQAEPEEEEEEVSAEASDEPENVEDSSKDAKDGGAEVEEPVSDKAEENIEQKEEQGKEH